MQTREVTVYGQPLVLVDTPGYTVAGQSAAMDSRLLDSTRCFVFVARPSARFWSKEDSLHIASLGNTLGDRFWQRLMVVFTFSSTLPASYDGVEQFHHAYSEALPAILGEQLGHSSLPFLFIDNHPSRTTAADAEKILAEVLRIARLTALPPSTSSVSCLLQ